MPPRKHVEMPASDEPGGSLSWRVGGLAGEGIDTAGDLLGKAMMRAGWHVWTTRHFPSRIRGGLTTCTVRVAQHVVAAPSGVVDVLVALHQDGADVEAQSLRHGGWLLYDPKAVTPPENEGTRFIGLPVPCLEIAKELGNPRVRNTVAIGASMALLGVPVDIVERIIVERFRGDYDATPWPEVARVNVEALHRGMAVAESLALAAPVMPARAEDVLAAQAEGRQPLFCSGNEAFAYGALVAGCRFYAGYPITPATTIMEYLAAHLPAYGGVALQVEDELAAVNMAIGAGFMGARAMTATSGPGLSLMAEAMGLAGSTETPVVIVDCQRPGPSTGMPTKTGQEDIAFAVAGGHGEEPKIVLAVEDLAAAYEVGLEAFDLAEHYQCPVIVLLELALSMGKGDTASFRLDDVILDRGKRFPASTHVGAPGTGEGYERYRDTPDGIPLRSVPGDIGGRHYANSTEHGPEGYTTEVPAVRNAMVARRERKLDDIATRHVGAHREGDPQADLGVIAFGAPVPVAREALAIAARRGVTGELCVLRRIWPLPKAELDAFFEAHERVMVVESNATGQLLRLLRSECPEAHRAESMRKYDGDPFRVNEVLRAILTPSEVTV